MVDHHISCRAVVDKFWPGEENKTAKEIPVFFSSQLFFRIELLDGFFPELLLRPAPPSSPPSAATSLHHSSSVEPSSSPPPTSFPQPSSHSADPQPTSSSV